MRFDGNGTGMEELILRERKANLEGYKLFTGKYLGEVEETDFFLKQSMTKKDLDEESKDAKRLIEKSYPNTTFGDAEFVSNDFRAKGDDIRRLVVYRVKILEEYDHKIDKGIYAYLLAESIIFLNVYDIAYNKDGLGKYDWTSNYTRLNKLYTMLGGPPNTAMMTKVKNKIFKNFPT